MTSQTRFSVDSLELDNSVTSELSQNQNSQLFEIYRNDAIDRAKHVKKLTERKTQLEMNLMKRESEARIAATAAAAAAVVIAFTSILTLKSRIMNDEDDVTDEISLEMTALNLRYASLSQNEIVRIFHNKFKPINLIVCDLCENFSLTD
jgi:hypothetical protein